MCVGSVNSQLRASAKREGVCRVGRRRGPYCEEQGWDWGAALHVDHGQHAGKVALPGSSKEQPGGEKSRSAWNGAESIQGCSLPSPGFLIQARLLLTQEHHPHPTQVPTFPCTLQPTCHRTHVHKCRCRQTRGSRWITDGFWVPGDPTYGLGGLGLLMTAPSLCGSHNALIPLKMGLPHPQGIQGL